MDVINFEIKITTAELIRAIQFGGNEASTVLINRMQISEIEFVDEQSIYISFTPKDSK